MPSAKPLRYAMNPLRLRHMNIWLRAFIVSLVGASLSSCIEFEREEIRYRHDVSADQLRMTLTYEGIFGGRGAAWSNDEAQEPHDPKKLTAQQKEQLESVLKGGRAFFFTNWIFEYDRSSLRDTLKKIKAGELELGDSPFGRPEKKLLQDALQNIELTNLGLYLDDAGRLCGAQTFVIKRLSNFLDVANEVIRRQVVHGIEEQLAKVKAGEKKPENAPSDETITLLVEACSKGHDFLILKKGRLVVRVPLGQREYLEFKKEILEKEPDSDDPSDNNLPIEVTTTYRGKVLTLVLGEEKDGVATLTKKCFAGYSGNALRYIRENHPRLLKDMAKIEGHLQGFLTGGD